MTIPSDLLDGYHRFRDERYAREERHYRQVAEQQKPHTMIIGCADSRVDPATIFDAMAITASGLLACALVLICNSGMCAPLPSGSSL